jgi:hypothetical protein
MVIFDHHEGRNNPFGGVGLNDTIFDSKMMFSDTSMIEINNHQPITDSQSNIFSPHLIHQSERKLLDQSGYIDGTNSLEFQKGKLQADRAKSTLNSPLPIKGLSSTRNVVKEARQDSDQLIKPVGKSLPRNLKSIWGRSNKSNID